VLVWGIALSLPGKNRAKQRTGRGSTRTIAETNHKNSKLSADTLKKQPLFYFVYSPKYAQITREIFINVKLLYPSSVW
jgi:hypothetical protein